MIRKQVEKPIPKLFGLRPARRQPSLRDRLMRKLQRYFDKMSPAKHVETASTRVGNAFRTELAGVFSTVLLAKKTLDSTRQVELPFPDKYFDGAAPVDEAGRAELEAYAVALDDFQERCMEDATPLSIATGQGVAIWIATIYGLTRPELNADVRRMWTQLVRGEDGIEDAFKLVIRREPSDMDREYFKYRPAALVGV